MVVHEWAFTAQSVGRLAMQLYQSIRQHWLHLPADEQLFDELVSVRLVKNPAGTLRLDHDSGQHDDQAVAIGLGVTWLMDAAAAPEFTVFETEPTRAGETNIFGLEVLHQAGPFAYRVASDDDWAAIASSEDEEAARTRRIVRGPGGI